MSEKKIKLLTEQLSKLQSDYVKVPPAYSKDESKGNKFNKLFKPFKKKSFKTQLVRGRRTLRKTYKRPYKGKLAYKRRYKRRYGSRRSFRRRRRPHSAMNATVGFPNSKFLSFKYCDTFTLALTGGDTFNSHYYRTNSLFDPDFTGTGHQPNTFDLWRSLYQQYRVVGSKIVVTFSTKGVLAKDIVTVGLHTTQSTTPASTFPTCLIENNRVKHKTLNPAGHDNETTMSMTWSEKKAFGKALADELTTPVDSNPTYSWYYNIFAFAADRISAPDSIICTVTLYQTALLTEPLDQDCA